MIFVSGTKRSGTSMWMQVLQAAGLPILGKAFPRNWGTGPLRDANPDGFYETLLRNGIYFATNPHPPLERLAREKGWQILNWRDGDPAT